MDDDVAIKLLRACRAMLQAFTRTPYNDDERHHALALADEAITAWKPNTHNKPKS